MRCELELWSFCELWAAGSWVTSDGSLPTPLMLGRPLPAVRCNRRNRVMWNPLKINLLKAFSTMFTLSTFQFVAFIYVYILIAPTQLLCAKIVLSITVSSYYVYWHRTSTCTTVAETQINVISVLNKCAGNILTSNSGCWQLTGIFIEKWKITKQFEKNSC